MLATEFTGMFPASLPRVETTARPGELVFRRGDRARGIFAVASGRIRLERPTVEGRESILHVALPGECFAEASLFSEHYHCDAVATTESKVTLYSKEDVLRHLRDDPSVSMQYISLLSSEVKALRRRVELSSILSARERIHHYLAGSVDADNRELRLTGSLKELAAELGLAPETLYRELRGMEEDGWIERRPDRLVLLRS